MLEVVDKSSSCQGRPPVQLEGVRSAIALVEGGTGPAAQGAAHPVKQQPGEGGHRGLRPRGGDVRGH